MPRVTITIAKQTPQPYRFPSDRESVTIGRGSENDITINCSSVSVNHAVMERLSTGYRIRDLDSTNGTKINDVRESVILLQDGSKIFLGDVAFDFQLSEEEKLAFIEAAEKKSASVDEPKPQKISKKSKPKPKAPAESAVQIGSPLQSLAMFFCFIVLAAIAFYIGLSLRHQKETGASLLESIVNKDRPAAPQNEPISEMPTNSAPAEAKEE